MRRIISPLACLIGWLLLAGAGSIASGQGMLIADPDDGPFRLPRPIIDPQPEPEQSYRIKELAINARIEGQVARTQVSQTFVNTGSRQMEVSFLFPLPYEGAIDRLTFMVDGQEYEATLLPADEARRIYEGYIRRAKDPALLEWMGRGMFKTSVFPVPPGQERQVTLRYSQVLRRERRLTDYLFPLSTAKYTSQPIESVTFQVSIQSDEKIKSVYSPTHAINIERPDDRHAVVKFEASHAIPVSDFRLFYDTSDEMVGTSLLSFWPEGADQGFFLMLASPQIESPDIEPLSKTVILVVDRSGSMNGTKIEQAKEALRFVLNNLREGDRFNIVAYDSEIESFHTELQRFNAETRQAALGFVESIYAGGSTNIDGALASALSMIQDHSMPNYIVFLTDGLPTAGETNEMKIVANTSDLNPHRARLINLGVGYDVNSRLLDRLSRTHRGQTEYVRPDEDLETHVSRLYSKINSPVMSELSVGFEFDEVVVEQGDPINRIYPRQLPDLFQGEQLVLAGRYRLDGTARIRIEGQVGDQIQRLDFSADFAAASRSENFAFVEKIWASRRIGEIIDEIDLNGRNEELVKELVELSLKHGILTPYTSFLADDQNGGTDLAQIELQERLAIDMFSILEETSGRRGFLQRDEKRDFQTADLLPSGGLVAGGGADDPRMRSIGGPGFGGGGFGGSFGSRVWDVDADREVATNNVQLIANDALYRRGSLWIASNATHLDPERDGDQIEVVERFSDSYFELIDRATDSERTVLAMQGEDAELLIRLQGQAYWIK